MAKFRSFFLAVMCVVLLGAGYAHAVDNILANGGFEDGIPDPWSVYGDATMEVMQGGAIEGNSYLHLTTPLGANFWDAGLQHAGHTFDEGKIYTLAAYLRSPNGLDINFKPELAADPWTGYGDQAFTMTDNWEEYTITTPPMPNDVNPATITFHIGYAVGEFDIDGVRFFEGEYVPAEELAAVQPEDKTATLWGEIKSR